MQQVLTSYKENRKYAYASGRIRVLETRLLNRSAIGRLLDADSASEVIRFLSEGEYDTAFADIRDPSEFEKALEIEMNRIYDFVDELTYDPELTEIFKIREDFHNLKVLIKASYLQGTKGNSYNNTLKKGTIPIDDIKLAIDPEAEKKDVVPDFIMKAINEARSQYEATQNPQMIDIVIDNQLHSFMYQRALAYSNLFLGGYLEALADLNNIKSFIRIKMLGEGIRLLDSALLPYGSLDKKLFLRKFDDTVESFSADLSNTTYADVVAEGLRRWSDDHSLAMFEKLADNYLINYIKPAKYIIFGVEPLIGYFLAKEHEIKQIRIIMIGKINGLPTEIINERLRDTYV